MARARAPSAARASSACSSASFFLHSALKEASRVFRSADSLTSAMRRPTCGVPDGR